MLIRKDQDLNDIQTTVFDIIIGIEEHEKQAQQKRACEKNLQVRRAIEERKQQKELEYQINDELWLTAFEADEN